MIGNERKGRLKSWDDAKGFGFIQPENGGADVFAHISVMRGDRRPQPGDDVLFIEGRDQRGRPRAEHLRLAGELSLDRQAIRRKPKSPDKAAPASRKTSDRSAYKVVGKASIQNFSGKAVMLASLCVLPLLGVLQLFGKGLWWILPLYLLASLLSFVQYWLDKRSAQNGSRRTAENTLHLVELAGGWPGALIAQQTFRHKTRKASYQAVFWMIVAAHQIFWVDLLLFDGAYIARHVPLLVQ
ncbi:cold-shock DNA-binding domain-containing protein [Ectopseudomonas mendocina]|uniref:DUF1294 domain-containing protein n=1 Tax=Ectopseudomonas mendocina TaxID=300 RepID=UPI000E053930|nr:cold shock and DUF1294 domain-containing protein [Pseudomonas mendocina]MBL0950618.1 cold shock and DUF1294 domain-containing protein [Pseudomonas sp.]SUD28765.1 cold-shock DNA-binding domain-containing protein [Pseudomonas mendocina]